MTCPICDHDWELNRCLTCNIGIGTSGKPFIPGCYCLLCEAARAGEVTIEGLTAAEVVAEFKALDPQA